MKCIIIYQSKTGFTKQYAKWIQEELHCDLVEWKAASKEMLINYDVIIFGSYIRIEKYRGFREIQELLGDNGLDKLVLFATGSTDKSAVKHIEDIWSKSIPDEYRKRIPHFYFQSGLNYEKMTLFEKLLMKFFALLMIWKNRKSKTSQDLFHSYDHSSKSYIEPLVRRVKMKRQQK